jgi:hypothetical protein
MADFANSSNQSASLKENYKKRKKYAEGGLVSPDDDGNKNVPGSGTMPQEGIFEPVTNYVKNTIEDAVGGPAISKAPMEGVEPEQDPFTAAVASGAAARLGEGAAGILSNERGMVGEGGSKKAFQSNLQSKPGIKVQDITPKDTINEVKHTLEDLGPSGTTGKVMNQADAPTPFGKVITPDMEDQSAEAQWAKIMNASTKPKKMADGGGVSAAPPAGLDEFLADSPQVTPPMQQASAPASTQEPEGLDSFLAEDTLGGQAAAFARAAGKGVAGPLAPTAEQAFRSGVLGTPVEQVQKEQRMSEEQYPLTSAAGEVTGLGASMATGLGEGALAMKAGEAAAQHLIPEAAAPLAKIGSRAVSDMISNAMIQSSDEASKLIMGQPDMSIETSAADVGLSGLIGGMVGAGIGSVSPLFKASAGKAGAMLSAMTDKLGGIEGQELNNVNKLLTTAGVELDPALKSVVEGNPLAQDLSGQLLQGGAKSDKAYQTLVSEQHNKIADDMIGALGHDPSEPIDKEISKYETGKNIGETLANEYKSQVSPLAEEFENIKSKTANKDLIPDSMQSAPADYSNPFNPMPATSVKVPGTISQAMDKLGQLATQQGWDISPTSEISKEFNRIMKELPALKTVKNLGDYITIVGDNTRSPTGLPTPLSRAGGLIRSVLKDAESSAIMDHLGQSEGPETVARYQKAREAYANQAKLKDYLNDSLHIPGSNTSNFAKAVRLMSSEDGEKLFNRLSGKNNADLLRFMQDHYPNTAEAVRKAHVAELLKSAADKAKPEQKISINQLRKSLQSMSPELRDFIAKPETLTKIDALGQIVDKLTPERTDATWRNRTIIGAVSQLPATVAGATAMLLGHNPVTGALAYTLGGYFAHETPATMRLALLKFLSSQSKVDTTAFKAMLQSMDSAIKGEELLSKGAQNVFKMDKAVLPDSAKPTPKDRVKLQKQLDEMQKHPESIMNSPNHVSHYMPEHGTAQAETVSRAAAYLDSIKPKTQQPNPLDTPIKPTSDQMGVYNNALDIAHQPLIILNKIKAGTATPQDVQALQSMYPNLYKRMSEKLTTEMTNALSKGKTIPYTTKLGLSHFLNQPMDSTMIPSAIQAAQPQQPQQNQQPAPKKTVTAAQSKGLEKSATQFQTQDQAREARANKK